MVGKAQGYELHQNKTSTRQSLSVRPHCHTAVFKLLAHFTMFLVKPSSASFMENIKPTRETDEIFHSVTGHSNAVKQKQVPLGNN
jgi:hypothetical protein